MLSVVAALKYGSDVVSSDRDNFFLNGIKGNGYSKMEKTFRNDRFAFITANIRFARENHG
jgi:hypothetical protein